MFRITPIVRNLLILNIGLFFLQSLIKVNLVPIMGLRNILAPEFAPWQFVTYMFMHASTGHLISNMIALFFFGPMLEALMGPRKFIWFYLITGVGAALIYGTINFIEMNQLRKKVFSYVENPNPDDFTRIVSGQGDYVYAEYMNFADKYARNPSNDNFVRQSKEHVKDIYDFFVSIPMVGASGSVFGILMAFAMFFPNQMIFLLFPPIPIKAKYLVGAYGIFEFFTGVQRLPGDNVAHFAHIGGMLVAFLLIKYWQHQGIRFK
ncbi:MAG: rhomboid family intramembrane serine protease [Cyclobacteriaceae bacterium]